MSSREEDLSQPIVKLWTSLRADEVEELRAVQRSLPPDRSGRSGLLRAMIRYVIDDHRRIDDFTAWLTREDGTSVEQ